MPGKRPSGRTPAGKGNGAGMGAGWGGPANGAHPQREAFTPETSAAANTHRAELMQTPEWWAQKANKEKVKAELKARLYDRNTETADARLHELLEPKVTQVNLAGHDGEAVKIEDTRRPVTEFIEKALREAADKSP